MGMTEVTQFPTGVSAACADGTGGEVSRVVAGPAAPALAHLAAEPEHRQGLVPLALAEVTADGIRFGCTLAEFARQEPARETHVGSRARADRVPGQVLALPCDGGLGTDGTGARGTGAGTRPGPQVTDSDVGPPGEVAVRRGEPVRAADGDIGRVQCLLIDRASHQVTHVLLGEEHPSGRRDVPIPVSAVAGGGDDGIRLRITRQEVQDLPPAAVADHSGQAGPAA
jgi:hypothetical protein